jgi:hypothetical protein
MCNVKELARPFALQFPGLQSSCVSVVTREEALAWLAAGADGVEGWNKKWRGLRSWSMATAAVVALAGGTPTRSRGAGGMTAAGRPVSLRVEGVPQRLPNRLLVDLKCGTSCPKTHPQPPQPTRLLCNPLESERFPRKHRKLQLHLRHGSNLESCLPISRLNMVSAAMWFVVLPVCHPGCVASGGSSAPQPVHRRPSRQRVPFDNLSDGRIFGGFAPDPRIQNLGPHPRVVSQHPRQIMRARAPSLRPGY